MSYSSKLREIQLKTADPVAFWHRINTLIKSKRLTQHEVAAAVGVQYPAFRGWSHRKYYPSIDHIYAIAQVLDTTVDYLIFGATEPVNKNSQTVGESLLSLIKLIKNELN